jgi:tetratricopeptide (TPR) repeat protein
MEAFGGASWLAIRHRGVVKPDRRAVVVAVVAVAAGVGLGYWAGAVPGVAAALAGLIPAAVLQVAITRQASVDASRASLARAKAAFAPRLVTVADAGGSGDGGAGGVARYLRPEAKAVRFWPRPELDELLAWVVSAERVAVRLVTGAGGSGKTRLAQELGEQAARLGWRRYWVPTGQEADAVGLVRAGGEPVLLVADYAETRAGVAAIIAAAAADEGGPAVRIVLLARSAGEWWQQLLDSTPDQAGDLLAAADPVTLGPVAARSDQQAVFAEALAAFASLREIACPDVRLRLADPDAVVLVVHAAALLAVLDAESAGAGGPSGGPLSGKQVLGGLLRHERRYWHHSLASRVAVLPDPDVIDRAVTAAFLVGAVDQQAAMRLLAVVEDLADAQLRGAVARWLHDLYPVSASGEHEWIGQLQPDLLTEQLVVSVAERHRDLIPQLLAGISAARARRALTILSRAALTQPAALDLIRQALLDGPDYLLVEAVAVTTETNPALAGLIFAVCAAEPLTAEALTALADAIPYPTVALAALDAEVTRQIVDTLPEGTPPAERASWLTFLGIALSQLGRPSEALPGEQEAVAAYRELAAASPHRYRSDLAQALNNLAVTFAELGRPAEALPVTQEAVDICRELADASPERYRPELARSLHNLGIWLAELSRPADALPVTQEAVDIRRELADASPDRYRPELARSLNNLGIRLAEFGRPAQALPVIQEAVAACRELAAASPDRYRPDLAAALDNLGNRLAELSRPAEALPVTQEAVDIRRELAAATPDRYRPELAQGLSNLGNRFLQLGLPAEALPSAQEAVQACRELAAASPDRFRPELARSLTNLGVTLSALGRPAEALPVTQEAVAACRELATARPDRYRPDLATSLTNLAACLSELGRTAEAEKILNESDS